MTKDYDFETATEGERWAYDQGIEAALDPSRMDMEDIQHALEMCVEALRRMIAERRSTDAPTDPTYTGRVIPPVEGLHDSGDGPYDPRD